MDAGKPGEINYDPSKDRADAVKTCVGFNWAPSCSSCDGIQEDPEHVFFHSPRFAEERNGTIGVIGKNTSTELHI